MLSIESKVTLDPLLTNRLEKLRRCMAYATACGVGTRHYSEHQGRGEESNVTFSACAVYGVVALWASCQKFFLRLGLFRTLASQISQPRCGDGVLCSLFRQYR